MLANRDAPTTSKCNVINFKLDSGASDHLKLMTFFNVVINVAKDGAGLVAKKEGVINGMSNRGVPINMRKVLYVSDLRDNLLSAKKLAATGVGFLKKEAVLKKDEEIIVTVPMRSKLYEIEIKASGSTANVCQVERNDLWHRRLGHLGQGGMANIVQNQLATRVDFKPRDRIDSAMPVSRVNSVENLSMVHVREQSGPLSAFIWKFVAPSIRRSGTDRDILFRSSTTRRTSP